MNAASKRALLSHLLTDAALERVIVFTRTKRGANRVAEALEDRGVRSEAIHGNKTQNARQKALDNFSRGKARVLVATDLASRGIDVTGVTHVINYELPADAESYVHRIGRTARAGASGIALSFCDSSERGQLKSIERLTNQRIAVMPTPANEDMPAAPPQRPREEREARDNERPNNHSGWPWRSRRWSWPSRWRRWPRSSPVRRSFPAARPSAPAEHQWSRGDYRDQPQGDRPQGDVLPPATPTARARRPIVPTRRARRATVRSAVRRAATAAVASAAVVAAAVAAVAAGQPSSDFLPFADSAKGRCPRLRGRRGHEHQSVAHDPSVADYRDTSP